MRNATLMLLTISLASANASAADVGAVWIAPIAAHTALCENGTSANADAFGDAARTFHTKLNGVAASGNLYFSNVAVDQATKAITWSACVPVSAGTKAPPGFQAIDVAEQQAVFAVCSDTQSTADCSAAAIALLSGRLGDTTRPAFNALLARGAKIPTFAIPPSEDDRKKVEHAFADPRVIPLHSTHDGNADTAKVVQDVTITRKPLSVPVAAPSPKPMSPPKTVSAVAIPFPPELADALAQAVAQ
jgi:hypothetical protein